MSVPSKIRPGSAVRRYPAGTHNWLVDKVNMLLSERPSLNDIPLAPESTEHAARVVNESDSDLLEPFSVLRVTGPLNEPATDSDEPYQGVRVVGATPNDEDNQRVVVLQQSALTDQIVDCIMFGPAWVMVDVQAEGDTNCGPVDGETGHLESGAGSIPIIWKESGTGEKWAIVLLGGILPKVGLATELAVVELDIPGMASSLQVSEFPSRPSGDIIPGNGEGNTNGIRLEKGSGDSLMWSTTSGEVNLLNFSSGLIKRGSVVQYSRVTIEGKEYAIVHAEDCG